MTRRVLRILSLVFAATTVVVAVGAIFADWDLKLVMLSLLAMVATAALSRPARVRH